MHNKKYNKIMITMVVIGMVILSGGFYWLQWKQQKNEFSEGVFYDGVDTESVTRTATWLGNFEEQPMTTYDADVPTDSDNKEMPRIYVHVCGQVLHPGVYELPEGSRVYEAIECAGGVTEEAASECLMLAKILSDEQRVYVPSYEESSFGSSELVADNAWHGEYDNADTSETSKVNLNRANKEQLMTLPGIGEARAEAIIQYRNEHGTFAKAEDIQQVSGIKSAAYAKIKDYIVVK